MSRVNKAAKYLYFRLRLSVNFFLQFKNKEAGRLYAEVLSLADDIHASGRCSDNVRMTYIIPSVTSPKSCSRVVFTSYQRHPHIVPVAACHNGTYIQARGHKLTDGAKRLRDII